VLVDQEDVAMVSVGGGTRRDLGPLDLGPFVAALRTHHTVHELTLPGFGEAPLPSWARSVAHLAALIGHELDARGLSGSPVVGLGFGGWVAAELLATSPARVGAVALVSPMGLRPAAGEVLDQFLWPARDYAELATGGAAVLDAALAGTCIADADAALDHSRETVTRVAWKPIGHDPALAGLLEPVHRPAAVVWGRADAVVPCATAAQWATVLRTDRVVTIDGGAHHVELSHPDAAAAAIGSFLGDLPDGG
jgi:pyruvate dehydrogenase E2 component (dihydrolipoamide acetyltransferase)